MDQISHCDHCLDLGQKKRLPDICSTSLFYAGQLICSPADQRAGLEIYRAVRVCTSQELSSLLDYIVLKIMLINPQLDFQSTVICKVSKDDLPASDREAGTQSVMIL